MLINFLDWSFDVDKLATSQTYAKITKGAAERCGCESCMLYALRRENVFPTEVIELFDNVGIDFAKEVGLYEAARFEGVIIYGGWFHFVGKILNDTTEKIYTDEKGKITCKMFKIRPLFDMGFWNGRRANYFEDNLETQHLELVQMEFVIMLSVDDMPESHDFLENMGFSL
jgi:hypothetical protein